MSNKILGKKRESSQVQISKSILKQQEIYLSLVGLRILSQETLKSTNSLPLNIYETETYKNNQTIIDNLVLKVKSVQVNLSKLTDVLVEKINKPVLSEKISNNSLLKKDAIIKKFANKIFDNWYNESILKSSTSYGQNPLLKSFTANISDNLDSYYDIFKKKLNASTVHKIIGLSLKENNELKDKQCYFDSEYYEFLLKEFINNNSEDTNEETLYNNSYLLLSSKAERKSKILSGKESKNRKIKYEKHEKIVKFTVPEDNNDLFQGRDELVKNIFGIKSENKKVTSLGGIKLI